MSELPAYACSCLNVKIVITNDRLVSPSPRQSQDESRSRPPLPVAGWEAIFVEPSSIKIAHEQLTLKSRSQDHVPLLICRLCNRLVCRLIDTDSTSSSSSGASGMSGFNNSTLGNPMSPSRDRPEFELFMQKDKPMWIQVCTNKDGCITGDELTATLKKASPVFGIIIPISNSVSPSPTPPTNPLPLPTPQQLLVWPELFPPPPFVPNHPLFAHLSKEAKKASAVIRTKAEEEMAKFVEQKRKEVAEQESNLKSQVNSIWRAWRESQEKSLPQGVPADPRVHTKRHSSTPSTTTVIRTFEADPLPSSRPARPAYHSTHPSISALATSLKQSTMHMPKPPSPPPLSPPSPGSEDLQATFRDSMRDPRPRKSTTVGPVSPPSTNSASQKKGDATSSRTKEAKASAMKRISVDGSSIKTDPHADGTSTPGSSANGEEGATSEKRKVKFSSERPNVVTVTREIKSEKLAKKEAERARGEEAMFDIDEEVEGGTAPFKSSTSSTAVTPTSSTNVDRKFPTEFTTTDADNHHPEVVLSFQMPSPVTNRKTKFEYTMAKSLPARSILHANRAPRAPALGLHAEDLEEENNARVSTSLRGQNEELKRMMAGQTPTHRSAWAAGEFFKSNATQRRKSAEDEDEDEDEDGSEDEDKDQDDDDDEDEEEEEHTASTHHHPAPSTSVPIGVPPILQHRPSTDDNFEATMSRSVDPGPALDLMIAFRGPNGTNSDDEDDDDELSDDDREAKDLMRKMTEGRGSLHAQRILSHTERGIPAHMWRSMV